MNVESVRSELRRLGFSPRAKTSDYYIAITTRCNQEFVDAVFNLVMKIAKEFESTLD